MVILQLGLALFFIASGIITLQLDSGFFGKIEAGLRNNEVAYAVNSLISNGSAADAVIIALGIIELLAGVFLLLQLFVNTGIRLTRVLMLVIIVVWIAVVILVDIMGKSGILGGNVFSSLSSLLAYFKQLSAHLLVLGSVVVVKD